MGFGSQLAVTKDLIVQASHGGDAGLGQSAGTLTSVPPPTSVRAWANIGGVGWRETGQAGGASLNIGYGGDVLVGGNLHIVGGNGGNNSMNATERSYAGNGGTARPARHTLFNQMSSGLTHLSLLLLAPRSQA